MVGALRGLVGDTGLHENDCECDNTHEQNDTICLYCYARQVLQQYEDTENQKQWTRLIDSAPDADELDEIRKLSRAIDPGAGDYKKSERAKWDKR